VEGGADFREPVRGHGRGFAFAYAIVIATSHFVGSIFGLLILVGAVGALSD
jgi:lysylphosphatidylglycerol synthetase-like protein (DUF2156 family)